MKKIVLFFVLFFSSYSITLAQPNTLTDSLNALYTTEQLAGSSTIGIIGDTIGYENYFGKRDIGRNLPIDENTMFRIASVSKSFTAAALMKLYEQNLFSLDDDVSTYLGFTLRNPSFPTTKITFRMLFNHTSSVQDGTGYDGFLGATSGAIPPPISQLFLTSGGYYTPNMFRTEMPGTYFNYSNVEYGLLGTLVEKISNTRFDFFVRQNLLAPLGATGSFNIDDLAPRINDLAVLYRKSGTAWSPQLDNFNGIAPAPRNYSNYTIGTNGLVFGPQGSLRITAKSLAKFLLMIRNNGVYGNTRILNDSTVRIMRSTQWNYTNTNSGNNYYGLFRRWGMGLHVSTGTAGADQVFANTVMWGHPGEAYGLISDMYIDTLGKKGVVFVTNGKFGSYTSCTTGFYCVEEKTFKYVDNWINRTSLPVRIVQFIGNKKEGTVELNWQTATETNNASFTIEKSSDGVNFKQLANIASAHSDGNSNQITNYAYTDVLPYKGNNYYRLSQTDKDGKITKHQTIQVRYSGSANILQLQSVFPNPIIDNKVNYVVTVPTTTTIYTKVLDITGKIISVNKQTVLAGTTTNSLFVKALASGSYMLLLEDINGNKSNTSLLIKY
jgi:CubicO group peptidase (beta-lactamase class C family)